MWCAMVCGQERLDERLAEDEFIIDVDMRNSARVVAQERYAKVCSCCMQHGWSRMGLCDIRALDLATHFMATTASLGRHSQ